MEYWSIDRLEERVAVCEDDNRQRREIPLVDLPEDVKEGDVLCRVDGRYRVDNRETERRRERNRKLLQRLRGQ